MQSEHKTKIAIVLGMALIVFVASLMSLPFTKPDAGVQRIPENSIKKMEASEEKILKFMAHEKNELKSRIYDNP